MNDLHHQSRDSRLWSAFKTLIALSILVGVGWQFVKILQRPELWDQPLRPRFEWLALSAFVYFLGQLFSAGYWFWLMRSDSA